ncbi:hypothetical protein BTA51_04100 [Hahella sp. CCB-MM4]|uniref:MerR family transcriptional regulator n=1 Tax=Hahella sp. (strain CCB-MM4) TaxID=1926491 RepID=UPI000B9A86EA|nr:effector binding domain-containing protein [Hahella sp. CCB-MM4]OZG74208.1 hypothetical protein BTA51_04100 [Hahella sp. CCB-MM4]
MITIGQMARLFGISTKTLRHYEAIGVFLPTCYGQENGYRYYDQRQVSQLQRILWLRNLGVSLDSIKSLQCDGGLESEREILGILEGHARQLADEMAIKQRALTEIHAYLWQQSKENRTMPKPRILEKPAFTVIGMVYSSADESDTIPALWGRYLPRESEIEGAVEPGVSYGLCLSAEGGEFRYVAGIEVKSGSPVPEGMISVDVAPHRYAVLTHTGPVMELVNTFREACTRVLPENGLEHNGQVDFELYDHRFKGPENPQSEVDIYLSIT